jgi:hypothetical protein
VVEEPVVLVVIDDEHGGVPQFLVGGQGLQLGSEELGAGRRDRRWVLVVAGHGPDERDVGQRAVGAVLLEAHVRGAGRRRVERVAGTARRTVAPQRVGRRHRVVKGGRYQPGGLELREVGGDRVLRPAGPLVELVADPGVVEGLGATFVGQVPDAPGLDDRSARLPLRVVAALFPEEPVHVGGAHYRAVVVVRQREGPGERPVEGDVFLGVVAHGERPVRLAVRGDVGHEPAVHRALIPGCVLFAPVVAEAGHGRGASGDGGHVPRLKVAVGVGRVGLLENRPAGGQPDRGGVVESPRAREGAEVVVEAAVLLHLEYQVLDLGQVKLSGARGRGLRQVLGQEAGEPSGAGDGGRAGHEAATFHPRVELRHAYLLFVS